MADEDNQRVPSEEGQTQTEQSSEGTDSGSEQKTSEAPLQVPDSLKGKSEQELIQMYQNLEKKIGEQSSEVARAREIEQGTSTLLNTIYSDPDRYKTVREWIERDTGANSSEGDDIATATTQKNGQPSASDDTRRTLQNSIIQNFYDKVGIQENADAQRQLGSSFAEILDPGGKKTVRQVLDSVPLDRLSDMLETAYLKANKSKYLKGDQSYVRSEANRQAAMGSLTSAEQQASQRTLTAEERAVAEKLGVKPEDYLKNKSS